MTLLAIAVATLCAIVVGPAAKAVTQHPLLLVVSFDGFHADYVRPAVTPHLARFREAAASPPYMRNVFPTKTFVNHFTVATGLYPETHGVLDNYMFDRNNVSMHYTYEQFHYNENIVPIWTQNENSGDGRYSGVMMWPGSEFPYQGKTPAHVAVYNNSIPWTSRVDKVMSWIKDDEKPANLVFVYFEEPDNTGHIFGIGSQEIKNQIVRVDTTVKYIIEQIKQENLENKINLMFLSDHGMDTITYDKIIFLDSYISNTTSKIVVTGPNAFVNPNPGKFDEVYNNLKTASNTHGHFDVFKKEQLPDRWHMKHTARMNGLIYVLAKPGYAFWDDYFEELLKHTTKEKFRAGTHGYDNEEPLMRAFFMASGPLFKRNFTARPFDNVDLYPLIGRLMDLKRPDGDAVRPNGTMAGVEQLLAKPATRSAAGPGAKASSRPLVVHVVLAAVSLCAAVSGHL